MPSTGGELRLPLRAVAAEIPCTIANCGATRVFRLDPPSHDVVVARRRISFPVEEVVAVLRRLSHVHPERHVSIRAFSDRHLRSADLHSQLLRVENIIFMNRELAGILPLLNDIGDNLNVSRRRILTARTCGGPLAEIA